MRLQILFTGVRLRKCKQSGLRKNTVKLNATITPEGTTEQNADCIYKLACNRTKDETHQAMEAAIHNFNSLNV